MSSDRAMRGAPKHDPDRPSQATAPYRTVDTSAPSSELNRTERLDTSSSSDRMLLLSRSPETTDAGREMTPPEGSGSVRYTKTGRVSKANKGQRVHRCDECGKIYTRAEHLRRHQQNHKPGAFPCDVPGCSRSFYREDLLVRHKARHNDPSSAPTPPLPDSPGSQTSGHDGQPGMEHSLPSRIYIPPTVAIGTTLPTTGPPPSTSAPLETRHSGKFAEDMNPFWRHRGSDPVCAGGISYEALGISGIFPGDVSPTSAYGTPAEFAPWPYIQQPSIHSAEPSYLGGYPLVQTSRSPVSEASSTTYIPQFAWEGQDHGLGQQESTGTLTLPLSHTVNNPVISSKGDLSLDAFDLVQARIRDRERVEARWLTVHTTGPDVRLTDPPPTNEQRYIGAYFTYIHHFYPVVHKPTFQAENVSTLLRSAILALGAQALPEKADKTNARLIHERCIAVLKERTLKGSHTYFVDDLQAILLVEVYSIFKSRRPPLHLSQPFEEIYGILARDTEALSPSTSDASPYHSDLGLSREDTLQQSSIKARCKHRILLACYILDQQHATLFGRPKQCHLASPALDLQFPASQSVWDDKRRDSARVMPHYLQHAFHYDQLNDDQEYDCFQSMLLMAVLMDETLDHAAVSQYGFEALSIFLTRRESQARCDLAYHTLMLCKSTPVRELLAVAGESWVMAEKLNNPGDFALAQMSGHKWALGEDDVKGVQNAIMHALKILEIHYRHPMTGLLFQEWSIYLAAIVVWAHAYVTAKFGHRDPSTPSSMPDSASMEDLDEAVLDVIARCSEGRVGMKRAKAVLLWTRAKIEKVDLPHNCGVTNGALDVLARLISRGDEAGWFGT